MTTTIAHGEVFLLNELTLEMAGRSIRTTGKVISIGADSETSPVVIEYNRTKLTVTRDRLVSECDLVMGMMFQFIGELMAVNNELQLRARVARCVEGADMRLYEQALQMMRLHLKESQAVV